MWRERPRPESNRSYDAGSFALYRLEHGGKKLLLWLWRASVHAVDEWHGIIFDKDAWAKEKLERGVWIKVTVEKVPLEK